MREGVGSDPVPPGHRPGRDEGVDDRLLGRLDHRVEQGIDDAVADGADVVRERRGPVLVLDRQTIAGREGEEQVAAGLAAGPSDPRDAEARTLRDPLALVGQERRVGGDDDDDRPRSGRWLTDAVAAWSNGLGTRSTPISAPTGTPSTRSHARLP